MLTDLQREHAIRRALRNLAKQRVALVLHPGNVWVIENVVDTKETDAALKTCHMRGWVEPLMNAVPKSKLMPDGQLPINLEFENVAPLYKLTSAGWSVIYRSYQLALFAVLISVLSLLISVAKY